MTARLRYQQTKIDGAPDTILVDAEIAAIIRAQQQWAAAWLREHAAPGVRPRYLFLGLLFNRNADRPYVSATLHRVLTELARRLDIRDSAGRPVDFRRTHRFRHTRATSLLNAGVPIHVVQRYLGHLSPAMTMHYAQTLAETHEAEFLRYRKLTADARDLEHRRPRPLRHAATGPADRPDLAQRLVPAAAPPVLRPGKRLSDLRQVRHRRQLPPRAAPAARPDRAPDRPAAAGLPRRTGRRWARTTSGCRPPPRGSLAGGHHHPLEN